MPIVNRPLFLKNLLKATLIGIWFCGYSFDSSAQIENPVGAAAAGIGGASKLSNDVWSVYNNIAGMSMATNFQAGFYVENKFAMKDLNRGGFAAIFPLNSYAVGMCFSRFGNSDLNTSMYGFGVSKKIAKGLYAGVKLNYLETRMGPLYGTNKNMLFEAGLLYEINKDFTGAFHIYNPNRVKFSNLSEKRLPGYATVALGYKVSSKVNIQAEGINDLEYGFKFRGGISYAPEKKYTFRMGLSSGPFNGTFGFGYKYHQWFGDIAAIYDINLGFSTMMSVKFNFNKEIVEKEKKK